MTLSTGSRVGPYELGNRIASTDSGERFTASEPGLQRPVTLVVAHLREEEGDDREAVRGRARTLAGLGDARLLPVYAQGEDGGVVWLTTRHLDGRPLTEIGRLDPARAARLGAQLASQLAALADAGLAPESLAPEDVTVEGSDDAERAWLVPDPARRTAASAEQAAQELLRLLGDRAGRPLLADPPTDPGRLAEALASLGGRPRIRRRKAYALAAIAVAAGGLAAGLALTLGAGNSKPPSAATPIARVVARIPVNAVTFSLLASDRGVWAATVDGLLVRVDPKTNRVVGTPRQLLPRQSYPVLYGRGDALFMASGDLIRLDPRTNRVVRRVHVGGKQPFIASLLATPGSLWATVSEQSSYAESLVRYDPVSLRELSRGTPFGSAPGLALVTRRYTVAVNAADGTLTKISPSGRRSTIAVSAGLQAYGSAYSTGRLWIATHVDGSVAEVDPERMVIERVVHLTGWPVDVVAGAGSVWALTERPSRIYRIDPKTARVLGRSIAAPAKASSLSFGAGALWVGDGNAKALVRFAPTSPAPGPAPLPAQDRILRAGPVPVGKRLVVTSLVPHLSIEAHEPGWLAFAFADVAQFEPLTTPGIGLTVVALDTPAALFDASGRLTRVRTAAQFLATLRRNPGLTVSGISAATVGGVQGIRAIVRAHPRPPYSSLCQGKPCVLLFPSKQGTDVLAGGSTDEFTVLAKGGKLFFVDASFRANRKALLRSRRLIASIRFER
ncbi:MAG TPA: hypothetical protein VFA66_04735 [Gaiellaceae bacterium]|nr:hypothetical protein [Gaiellaceae bacterium]